ncbi:hypothetical protein A2U01_0062170, partial [Trifolium medium]|nr:hypothetical protein [Trifolium medium]
AKTTLVLCTSEHRLTLDSSECGHVRQSEGLHYQHGHLVGGFLRVPKY